MCCVCVGTCTVTSDCAEASTTLAKVSLPSQVITEIQGTQDERSGRILFLFIFLLVKRCELLSGPFVPKAACNRNDL